MKAYQIQFLSVFKIKLRRILIMYFGVPQVIYLALIILGLGIAIAKHGQPRDNYNGGVTFIAAIIELALLYWGGFFK
jgi:hypothetical protein